MSAASRGWRVGATSHHGDLDSAEGLAMYVSTASAANDTIARRLTRTASAGEVVGIVVGVGVGAAVAGGARS